MTVYTVAAYDRAPHFENDWSNYQMMKFAINIVAGDTVLVEDAGPCSFIVDDVMYGNAKGFTLKKEEAEWIYLKTRCRRYGKTEPSCKCEHYTNDKILPFHKQVPIHNPRPFDSIHLSYLDN